MLSKPLMPDMRFRWWCAHLPNCLHRGAGGEILLKHHRISLYDVVFYYREGYSESMQPILRREPLRQAENKYRVGLPIHSLFGPIRVGRAG